MDILHNKQKRHHSRSEGRLQIYMTADELREWNGQAKIDGLDGKTTFWVMRIVRLYMRGELVRKDACKLC